MSWEDAARESVWGNVMTAPLQRRVRPVPHRVSIKYYVYEHFDPVTGEVVYVGEGSSHRAWVCAGTYNHKSGRYLLRSKSHTQWAQLLLDTGYTPDQFVRVTARDLTKADARILERQRIKLLNPRFNCRVHHATRANRARWGPGTYCRVQAEILRKQGFSYTQIAKKLASSTMTVWRNLGGNRNAD